MFSFAVKGTEADVPILFCVKLFKDVEISDLITVESVEVERYVISLQSITVELLITMWKWIWKAVVLAANLQTKRIEKDGMNALAVIFALFVINDDR
jgi:hypothetical protein